MTVETSLKQVIEKIEAWDHKIFLSFYKSDFSQSSKIKRFAQIYSFFGNFYFWGALWLIMVGYAFFFTKDYYLTILFTGAFDQAIIIYLIIRYYVVNRNRPFIKLGKEGVEKHDDMILESKSFPSGHVTFFLYFGFIFAFFFQNWWIILVFFMLDIVMAITRLILGMHFPSDVIGGILLAPILALLYLGVTYTYWVGFYYWLGDIWQIIKNFILGLFI